MKKIIMVLLLTTLFQGFAMANEVEEQATLTEIDNENKDTTKSWEKASSPLERDMLFLGENTNLQDWEISIFLLIYDKFGYKATYETYCILYDVTLEDWEVDLYIDGCLKAGIAAGLYTLEYLAGKITSKQ